MLVSLFRRAGVSREGHQQFPFLWKHSPNQKSHLWVFFFFWPFESLPWIKKTSQSPTHTFFLSSTGTNRYVFAERLTASKVLSGSTVGGKHESVNLLLSLSSMFPIFFRMKPELFVVIYKVLFGPLSVSFSLTSFFSPNPPLTSKILVHFGAFVNAILHPLTWLIPTSSSGFNSDIPSSGGLT